jgi:hypothetical protein
MVLCADSQLLAWGLSDLSLRLQLQTPHSEEGAAELTCFSASKHIVVAGSANNGTLYFWELARGVNGSSSSDPQPCSRVVLLPSTVRQVRQVDFQSDEVVNVLGDDGRVLSLVGRGEGGLKEYSIDFSIGSIDSFSVGPRFLVAKGGGGSCTVFDLLSRRETSKRVSRQARKGPATPDPTHEPFHGLEVPPPSSTTAPQLDTRDLVNTQRVAALLAAQGRLPEKHRPLTWRCLLHLPQNTEAFAALVRKGPHPSFSDLGTRFPLRDSRTLRKLSAVLSALAWWSPLCAELEYLPATVFPFLKVFSNDDLAVFEASVTLLARWERHYLCTYPHPPLPLLSSLERALALHDPGLVRHLNAIGVGPQVYAWPLLRSAFTEVLWWCQVALLDCSSNTFLFHPQALLMIRYFHVYFSGSFV